MKKNEYGDELAKKEIRRHTRRGFLGLGIGAIGAYFGWAWIRSSEQIDGIPGILRKNLEVNEALFRKVYSPERLAPTFDLSEARMPRANGLQGMGDDFDPAKWKLQIVGADAPKKYPQYVDDIAYETSDDEETESDNDTSDEDSSGGDEPTADTAADGEPDSTPIPGLLLNIEDLRKLPRYEMVTELKCIEGWSEKVLWAGARFSDLIAMFPPPTRDGSVPDLTGNVSALVGYIMLQTPDEGYYVGLDMSSALHPQTLLCYEMNGEPLSLEHGSPLRLVTPLRYGIKHIKRIGCITYTDERPKDFWAERGYDWYAAH